MQVLFIFLLFFQRHVNSAKDLEDETINAGKKREDKDLIERGLTLNSQRLINLWPSEILEKMIKYLDNTKPI